MRRSVADGVTPPPRVDSVRRQLLLAHLINDLGSGVSTIALPLLVYFTTGSVVSASLIFLVEGAAAVVFGLVGGAHADRFDRRRLIVASAMARAALTGLIPLAFAAFGVPSVVLLGFLINACRAFSGPALSATMPSFFGAKFQDYVGKRAVVDFAATAVGPALGGALVGTLGAANAVYVDAVSFLLFGLLIARVREFSSIAAPTETGTGAGDTLLRIRQGLSHARNNPAASTLLLYWFLSLCAVPLSLIAAIPYVTEDLGKSSFQYGLATSCYAVASLVSSLIAGKLKFRGGARIWLIASGLVYGCANLAMIFHPDFVVFCLLWAVWGLAYGPESVVGEVAFARTVLPEYQARMYALMDLCLSVAGIVGALASGGIIAVSGPTQAMFVAGIIFVLATCVCFVVGPGARALASVPLTDDYAEAAPSSP